MKIITSQLIRGPKNMTRLTVFELAQQEAEENVWIPTKATRFISRLLSRRHTKLETISATEGHEKQDKRSEVRMRTQLRPTSRQRYVANRNVSPSKIVRTKRTLGSSRSARSIVKSTTGK
jgi:hypothetical protein